MSQQKNCEVDQGSHRSQFEVNHTIF